MAFLNKPLLIKSLQKVPKPNYDQGAVQIFVNQLEVEHDAGGGGGVIPGGTTNQVLAKASNADFDLVWNSPAGGGTVTTTGSPASGNLTKFSGAASITNGDLSGDVTTSGTLVATLANIPNATPAAGSVLATAIAAPSTPAAGKGAIYVDSTSKNLAVKDDAGTVKHGVQSRTATASNWIRSIADDGSTTISQPVASDVGLGSVTNDVQTKAAIVPNTAPSSGQVLVGNAGGTAYAPQTVSGSGATITMSSAGLLTISSIPNATLQNSSVTISGHALSLGGSLSLSSSDVGLGSVTNDVQTKAAIVPNTVPSAGQILAGNAGGTAYAPATVSGSGATISLSSSGVLTISSIPNATLQNSSVTISGHAVSLGGSLALVSSDVGLGSVTNDAQTKASVVPNTLPGSGQLLVGNAGGTAYVPQTLSGSGVTATLSNSGVLTLSAIPNATLVNSSITISGGTVSLGGSINPPDMFINGYGTNFTVPDTGNKTQPDALNLAGSEAATVAGTGAINIYDSISSPPGKGSFSPGSFILKAGEYLLQYLQLLLNGNQQVTLTNDAVIVVSNLAPIGTMALTGT